MIGGHWIELMFGMDTSFMTSSPEGWDFDDLLTNVLRMKEFCDYVFFNHNCFCTLLMPTHRAIRLLTSAIRKAQSAYCTSGEHPQYVLQRLVYRFKRLKAQINKASSECYYTYYIRICHDTSDN